MTFLTATDLVMDRNGSAVLSISRLDVQPHSRLLIAGPSGCGKTTLLHILAGLLRPTSGDVRFKGRSYAAMDDNALDALRGTSFGFVFQQLHLIKHLSVRDNIRLAAPGADIAPLLQSLGIGHKEKAKISDLSVGEAQRVAVARALANNPAVIFADEPTSSLDDANAENVITLLRDQAARSGAALIVASHDARITAGFETTLRLNNGKVTP